MKAARLYKKGEPLKVEEVPVPKLLPNGVIVKVQAVHTVSFAAEVVSGARGFYMMPPFPTTLGPNCVGIVEEVGEDVRAIKKGQQVLCSGLIQSPSHQDPTDSILLGWTLTSPDGALTQKIWKDGAWAEKVHYPSSNVTVVPEELKDFDPALISILSYYAISLGGLKNVNFEAGQSLIVNAATGALGVGSVLCGLALGASRLVITGRDKNALQQLVALDPHRIVSVNLADKDWKTELTKAAKGGVDVVVDCVADGPSTGLLTDAAIECLKSKGKAVIVGNPSGSPAIPYSTLMRKQITLVGSFMYEPSTFKLILTLAQAKLIDLNKIKVSKFPLEKINEAIEEAAKLKGLQAAVVVPSK